MAKSLVNRVREGRIREGIKRVGKGIQKAVLITSAAASIGVARCRPCINHAPYIEDIPIIYVDEGNEYSQMVEAGDVDGNPISYALTADNELEEGGISINQTGRITGTAPMVNADTEYAGEVGVSDGIVTEPTSKTFKVQVRNVVEPTPENNPPVASLNVTPTSGVSPLGTEIKVTGTDIDAGDYITDYEAEIDLGQDGTIDETIPAQSTSIDVFRTLNTSAYIYGQVTDSHGAKSPRVSQTVNVSQPPPIPPADDYLDISGKLEDCENDGTGRQGVVRVYDTDIIGSTPLSIKSVTKGTKINNYDVQPDTNGDFSVTLEKIVDSSDKVFLQAVTGTSATPTSYVRTIVDLPAVDTNLSIGSDLRANPAVRVVPYDNPNDSYDDGFLDTPQKRINFKRHVELTNGSYLSKFDINNFQEAEIMSTNRDGTGHFDSSIVGKVKNDLAQWFNGNIGTDGELYVHERLIPVSIVSKNIAHYDNFANRFVYEPYSDLGSSGGGTLLGSTSRFPTNGDYRFTNGALIRLLSNDSNSHNPLDYVRLHEEGHGSDVSPGESYWRTNEMPSPNPDYIDPILYYRTSSSTPWNGLTVMETGIFIPSTSTIGIADLKTREIVHQNTFQSRESINNYLELSFGFN